MDAESRSFLVQADAAARMHNWTVEEWTQWIADAPDPLARSQRKAVAFPYLYGQSRRPAPNPWPELAVITEEQAQDLWHEIEAAKLVGLSE
jgi:hypothetical protein